MFQSNVEHTIISNEFFKNVFLGHNFNRFPQHQPRRAIQQRLIIHHHQLIIQKLRQQPKGHQHLDQDLLPFQPQAFQSIPIQSLSKEGKLIIINFYYSFNGIFSDAKIMTRSRARNIEGRSGSWSSNSDKEMLGKFGDSKT